MNDIEDKLLREYHELKPQLEAWGAFVDNSILNVILRNEVEVGIIKLPPKYRSKVDSTYLIKALYQKRNYTRPIHDIEDKVGTRVVVLKSSDVSDIADKLLTWDKWQAKLTKNTKAEIEGKPKIFDYQSIHIVVWPHKDADDYDDKIKDLLTCEIQIRTLLQHAFAEISHDSTYKGPYQNDSEILRRLSKAMALMEATDDYFCEIFNMMSDEKRRYHAYYKNIVQLYEEFVPDYSDRYMNIEFTDTILGLLSLKDVNINDLSAYVERHREELVQIYSTRASVIYSQPISLLIQYYFSKCHTFLRENWPLNVESLKNVYLANNTSFDSY